MDPLTAAILAGLVAAPVLRKNREGDNGTPAPDGGAGPSLFDLPKIAYQQQLAAWEARIRSYYDDKIRRASDPEARRAWKEERDRLKAEARRRPRFERLRDWAERHLPTEEELDAEGPRRPLFDRLRDWWTSEPTSEEEPAEPDPNTEPRNAGAPEDEGPAAEDPPPGSDQDESGEDLGGWWSRWRRRHRPPPSDPPRYWAEEVPNPPAGGLTAPPSALPPVSEPAAPPEQPDPATPEPSNGGAMPDEPPVPAAPSPAPLPAGGGQSPASGDAKPPAPAPASGGGRTRAEITYPVGRTKPSAPPRSSTLPAKRGGDAAPGLRILNGTQNLAQLSSEQKVYIQQDVAEKVGLEAIKLARAAETQLSTLIQMRCGENRLRHARQASDHLAQAVLNMQALWRELGIDDVTIGEAVRARRHAAKQAEHYT